MYKLKGQEQTSAKAEKTASTPLQTLRSEVKGDFQVIWNQLRKDIKQSSTVGLALQNLNGNMRRCKPYSKVNDQHIMKESTVSRCPGHKEKVIDLIESVLDVLFPLTKVTEHKGDASSVLTYKHFEAIKFIFKIFAIMNKLPFIALRVRQFELVLEEYLDVLASFTEIEEVYYSLKHEGCYYPTDEQDTLLNRRLGLLAEINSLN